MFRRIAALATISVLALTPLAAHADPPSGGDLDPSFGANARMQIGWDEGFDDSAQDMVVQPDGKIVMVGRAGFHESGDFAIVRLNPNGSLDSTFGDGGKVRANYAMVADRAFAVALQSDGKIVVAGYGSPDSACLFCAATPDADDNFLVVRVNPDGSMDNSFHDTYHPGKAGVSEVGFAGGQDHATGVGIQSDGKIVVTGWATNPGGTKVFAAARLQANGNLDTSYGQGGRLLTNVPAFVVNNYENSAAKMRSDNKMVVVGGTPAGADSSNSIALRITENGQLDPGFGSGGVTMIGFGGQSALNGLTLMGDGRIVATGAVRRGLYLDTTLVRMNANGSLDPSFGAGGLVVSSLSRDNDIGNDVLVQPNGKIVVGGVFYEGNADDMSASRFLPDGRLDITFGQIGIARAVMNKYYDQAYAIAQQGDGRLILAGRVFNGSTDDDIAVARLWGGDGLQGGRARPIGFDRPGPRIKKSRLRAITGTANAKYLDWVELAIHRPNRALLRKRHACVWMQLNGRAVRAAATKVGPRKWACTRPVWNKVIGTYSWNARVSGLKPGKYVLIGRGMTDYGQLGATSSRRLRITRG